jgi:FHA domain
MILTLEITGPREGTPQAEGRKVFHEAGGTIGRLPDNDLVLPDPYVSSRHARIRYANGVFHIEDTSTNGVFVNTPENRLTRGQPYALKSGDRIFIEPYEIRASIGSEPVQTIDDPFAPQDPFGRATSPPPLSSAPSAISADSLVSGSDEVDPLRALGFDAPAAPCCPSTISRRRFLSPRLSGPPDRSRPITIRWGRIRTRCFQLRPPHRPSPLLSHERESSHRVPRLLHLGEAQPARSLARRVRPL